VNEKDEIDRIAGELVRRAAEELDVAELLLERIERFRESATRCKADLISHPRGERLDRWLECMRGELRRPGAEELLPATQGGFAVEWREPGRLWQRWATLWTREAADAEAAECRRLLAFVKSEGAEVRVRPLEPEAELLPQTRRARYDRRSLPSAIDAARRLQAGTDIYVFATYSGYTVSPKKPPPGQPYVVVRPDGTTETVRPSFGSSPRLTGPVERREAPGELEFFADSADHIRASIDHNGLRPRLEAAFQEAIRRVQR